ncbi:hypothetical protein B0T25DRAFT_529849 [Lasiosphaeria hispida]|uniref:Uncharacterized protein n=1 Tax=Lasiosphaeria hispida TaxID=260671 RepID=A0AAJ0HXB5_9PEZI|nr:hypothetical protein B0T25DRAFT_529849 [Lasiosphaeria hispida]
MRPSLRSVVAAGAVVIAALVVVLPLVLFTTGTAAMAPAGVRPVPIQTTKSASDLEEAASVLEGASADWTKALKDVTNEKPWNLTATHRAAAKKTAEALPWVGEDIVMWALVAFGAVAAVIGPARLLRAGTRVLWASWLWVRVAGRRLRAGVLAWWRGGVWELLGTLFESVRWRRFGPGRTLGGERGPLREWLRVWDNYLAGAPM